MKSAVDHGFPRYRLRFHSATLACKVRRCLTSSQRLPNKPIWALHRIAYYALSRQSLRAQALFSGCQNVISRNRPDDASRLTGSSFSTLS